MNPADSPVKTGPNGQPVRAFVLPESFGGRLRVWRLLLLRRALQLGVLLVFFGTLHWGWKVAGKPVLSGNLSSSELFELIPMADPFAVLQILFTGQLPLLEVLTGAAIILGIYALLGGRTWCAWVCPLNMVTDLAAWLRRRLGITDLFRLSRNLRYTVLALVLVLSVLTGVAAFEWISPIGMLHRELIYGIGLGWTAVLGVFLFDLFILRNGWCGHLCPLGAFYALVGRLAQLRIRFDTPTCTHCGECARVCPEPQVLNLKQAGAAGMIASGECSNCGRCISICPEGTLQFSLRHLIDKPQQTQATEPRQRRAA
ncbi:MAG TPA: quinol dehydrogenase ferredoxin subunit NapH [Gammaproteobacteria bacterium]|nr:quinol dehydrogenase ferredoxin subunit NapH [Gammaproteobacteria bacterium]